MVEYKVIITERVRDQMKSVYVYLKEHSSSQTASKVHGGILDEISDLSRMPHKNTIVNGFGKNRIYRRRLKWSYKIIYTIDDVEKLVFVVLFLHQKQDIRKHKDIFE